MTAFAKPLWLYAGLPITLAVAIFLWWSEKRKLMRLEQFAATKLLSNLTDTRAPKKIFLRCSLLSLATLMFFIILAQPQWGTRQRERVATGIDIIIALDVSRSMLARDVEPNRIERVKRGIANQLEKVQGDRLGLIAFAGTSFLHCPLTPEHNAFRRTLESMSVGTIKQQGTDLAQAIETAEHSFSKNDKDRFLILISDGDDLEQRGLSKAKEAAQNGIRIYTIGIGTEEGERIPLDGIGKPARNFLKDPNGKEVLAKIDDSWLRSIAEATGGEYIALGQTGEGLRTTFEKLQAIGHEKRRTLLSEEFPIERYQLFLPIVLGLLMIEFILGNRRVVHVTGPTLALFIASSMTGCLSEDNLAEAENAYQNDDFSHAADLYESEIEEKREQDISIDPRLRLNAGLSHLEAGNFTKAYDFLLQAQNETMDKPHLQSTILNALGNLHYAEAREALGAQDVASAKNAWEKAIQCYEDAWSIDQNPKAKKNLENLEMQLKERVLGLVSSLGGVVWRDLDGNGRNQANEPRLPAKIFWDKNKDGEHNSSFEPFVETNRQGYYEIEWISTSYPATIHLGCILSDSNLTSGIPLIAVIPQANIEAGQLNATAVKLAQASKQRVNFPYRRAPWLKGSIWNDTNQDGTRGEGESGYANATLYLDLNENGKRDEDESSFQASSTGNFSQPVPPGHYRLRVHLDSQKAKVTFPLDDEKSYSGTIDFENLIEKLDFGIHSPSNQDSQANKQDPENQEDGQEKESTAQNKETQVTEEVNALYKSLLEEFESKNKQLRFEEPPAKLGVTGRNY